MVEIAKVAADHQGRVSTSVHSGHLVLVEAELFGFQAQAGNAVGHVDARGGGAGGAGTV